MMDQMPNLRQINIPVNLSQLQAEYHASYAKGLSQENQKIEINTETGEVSMINALTKEQNAAII